MLHVWVTALPGHSITDIRTYFVSFTAHPLETFFIPAIYHGLNC